uniref:Uncharacterized protein n=1 Tax=Euplotes crassus TaxID=5936 RepID=A0A7S3KP93_EUPCR|mmetsp:Transcript_3802/g.3547  ORF Transcript_3802/g.3547 Transcript_3802/m.3547 type:complete len:346 (+) Transcript_3802:332-1369(+)
MVNKINLKSNTRKGTSSKRKGHSKEKHKNANKRRPMSVFEQSRAINNQTMLNEIQFDRMRNSKISPNPPQAPLSQQITIDRRSAYTQISALRDIQKIQNKLEMRANVSPDRNYSDATTATGSHDERRVSIYLRALSEVAQSNPECSSLFNYITELVDSLFQSLLKKKNDENESIAQKIEKTKKEILEERRGKEKAQNLYQKLLAAGDNITTMEEKRSLIQQMHQKIQNKEEQNKQLALEVRKLRKRELEIIKRWDMDDIDLVTERLKLIKSTASSDFSKKSSKLNKKARKSNIVPTLDFTRVYEIQNEQNMDYEEEEEEDEEEQEFDHGHLSESAKRQIELQSRK